MDAMTKVRDDLAAVIEQAEAMTTRDEFNPEDPGYVALRDQAQALERSYRSMAEWAERKAESDKIGAALHRAGGRREEVRTRAERPETFGEAFTRSDAFTDYRGRGTSARVDLDLDLLTRALPHTVGDMGAALPPAPVLNYGFDAEGPQPLISLMPTVPVGANSLDIVTWEVVAGGADVTAEGVLKPSVEYAPTATTITLDTIAVWTSLTRQLLEDAPAVRALMDTEMRRDIIRKQEAEAAAALVAATLPAATDTTSLLAAIRKGYATVQEAGYIPDAVLLNPADWAALDLDVFGSTLNGPVRGQSFWGLRPVASSAQPAGTATVGDFSAGVQRFVRSGVQSYITDSHSDFFTKNLFTLLAEARAKSVVVRPAALVECSVAP